MKLKLEFRILNQLTEIAQEKLRTSQAYFSEQSDTMSVASPITTSAGIPAWSADDSPGEKAGITLRDSHTAHLIKHARPSLGCESTSSRRFSQPDHIVTNTDEKVADMNTPSLTRPSPV